MSLQRGLVIMSSGGADYAPFHPCDKSNLFQTLPKSYRVIAAAGGQ